MSDFELSDEESFEYDPDGWVGDYLERAFDYVYDGDRYVIDEKEADRRVTRFLSANGITATQDMLDGFRYAANFFGGFYGYLRNNPPECDCPNCNPEND